MITKTFGNKLASVYGLMAIGFLVMMIPFFMPVLAVTSTVGMIGCFVGMIALIFAIFMSGEAVGRILFGGFALLTGMLIYPAIAKVMVASAGVVMMAAFLTGVMFIILSVYAVTTKRDFTGFGKYLFLALFVLLIAMVANIFFKLAILNLIISYVAVIVFSFSIVYDTQVIRDSDLTTAQGALSLFLNVVNLFLHLLNILDN